LLHLPINIFLAIFWLRFVLISFFTFLRTGSWFGLGLMVFNSLLVFFFLTRRQSKSTTSRWSDWMVSIATVLLSMSLKPDPSSDLLQEIVSVALQTTGLSIMLYSLVCLGKSFGIVPANRSVKSQGAYAVVRHPLYAGELIFYFGFLFGHFNYFNLIKILLIFLGQLWRVQAEESVLRTDKQYRDYCLRVPYRFLPKLY
jgi:protein-S-isoprenylcysteine O-methyltransferase Ste14